jgi:hypothetical protein
MQTRVMLAGALLLYPAAVSAQEVSTRCYYLSKSAITVCGTVTMKNTFPSDFTQGTIPAGSVENGLRPIFRTDEADVPNWSASRSYRGTS